MAKIQEEIILVKLSKLLKKDADSDDPIAAEDLTSNLEAIVQELVGDAVIVEVEKA